MNTLTVFDNNQFGRVRSVLIEDEPWFVAADVCRALDISNSRQALARLDEDEKGVISTDTPGGEQKMAFVNEPGLYSLVMGSRKPEARDFKRWITHEVIPSIRKTGAYAVALSPAEQLVAQAQLLVEQEKRLAAMEGKVKNMEARLETRVENAFSIAGYASLRGLNVDVNTANLLGKKAAAMSREYGYPISTTPDPRFGKVNVYHTDILKIVFDEALGRDLIRYGR
ncbi:MAG: Bro-N domain-containing protein [Clostridia bacterium]|nr:Bro-N domain-containing protein [Clostridia bacterium]